MVKNPSVTARTRAAPPPRSAGRRRLTLHFYDFSRLALSRIVVQTKGEGRSQPAGRDLSWANSAHP
ncbi:hypothetical protein BREVUG8_100280 [Brevundimonas sp. G8]|nr:hypothetical protein BREVUG8_100280 [Brevundimonas sp. G8]